MKPSIYLNDIETAKIQAFVADKLLIDAVRKVLLASIYNNGTLREGIAPDPLKNAALGLASVAITGQHPITDEQLGQDIRGMMHGIQLLELGLTQLAKFTKDPEDKVSSSANEAI